MSPEVLLHDADQQQWLHFHSPRELISAASPDDVPAVLRQVETRVEEEGLYAAGFLTYEAAAAFDPACHVFPPGDLPLAWFGLFDPPVQVPVPTTSAEPKPLAWQPSWTEDAFTRAVTRIHAAIAAGETYQVNLTFPLTTHFSGSAQDFFANLVQGHRAGYAAYFDLGEQIVCSVSPELFFKKKGRQLVMRPMKGTLARGLTSRDDQQRAEQLRNSAKDRAENIMILDMVRNDLGRLAEPGTVTTSGLCALEKYPTVWQMTSTVTAETSASLAEIMAALFPCASITGAPKLKTMEIIKQLEQHPRGVYTGCLGYLAPQGKAQFNVAIRTALIDRFRQTASYGVGAGITWDSSPGDEYRECLQKARVLTHHMPEFALFETLLWRPEDGYWLLDEHLDRLVASAGYFDFPCHRHQLATALQQLADSFAVQPYRVRLRLTEDGRIEPEATPFDASPDDSPVHLRLASTPIDPTDPFLYHKTTMRSIYERARADRPDCDDVILWTPSGEITETTIANLVLDLDGSLVTPPTRCGLLPGTFREHLLTAGKLREQVVTVTDLQRCRRLFLINALRGWREATFQRDET